MRGALLLLDPRGSVVEWQVPGPGRGTVLDAEALADGHVQLTVETRRATPCSKAETTTVDAAHCRLVHSGRPGIY